MVLSLYMHDREERKINGVADFSAKLCGSGVIYNFYS